MQYNASVAATAIFLLSVPALVFATTTATTSPSVVTTAIPTVSITHTLTKNDNGADVLALQQFLAAQGFLAATPNGTYGPATTKAVTTFQKTHKLTPTGSVGPKTLALLQKLTSTTSVATSTTTTTATTTATSTPDATQTDLVTQEQLHQALYGATSTMAGGGVWGAIAASQRINSLNNVTISGAQVNGVSGLTASDIPTNITASNYLPLSGGTLTGTTTIPALSLSNAVGTAQCLHTDASGNVAGTGTDCSSVGGDVSSSTVLATGATTARTLAAWTGDTISIMSYAGADPTGVTNSDTAFTAAITAALSRPFGAKIVLPAGNFKLSAAQTVAMSAQQGFMIEGQGPGITTITQTGQADAFDIQIAHYTTRNGQYVGFRNLTLSYTNTTPGSSAIKVTTNAVGGQQGNPFYVENCSFVGAWNFGIDITKLPTQAYVSNSTFFLSSNSTAISFKGDVGAGIYSIGLMLDNIVSWNGYRFLYIGPYVQGVIARGLNVAAASQSIFWDASAGAGEQFVLSNSYVMRGVYLDTSGAGTLTGVQINNNFFDGEVSPANELNIVGVLEPQVTNNMFFGSPTQGGTALYFGNGAGHGVISNNVFSGFMGGSGDGNGITLDAGATNNIVSQNNIINTTSPAADNGTSNIWVENSMSGIYTSVGFGGSARGANSVEIQPMRTSNSHVASGAGAIAIGNDNTSNAASSTAIGSGNVSNGIGTIAMGLSNTANASQAVAMGIANSATGNYSMVTGSYATDRGRVGSNCSASGNLGVGQGDAQYCTLILHAITTSASPTTLTADGNAPSATNCINIPTSRTYTVEASLVGTDTASAGNIASVVGIRGVLYRGVGNATWVSGNNGVAQGVGTGAVLLPNISADTSNQCLNISIAPPNTDLWHWVARVQTVEVR